MVPVADGARILLYRGSNVARWFFAVFWNRHIGWCLFEARSGCYFEKKNKLNMFPDSSIMNTVNGCLAHIEHSSNLASFSANGNKPSYFKNFFRIKLCRWVGFSFWHIRSQFFDFIHVVIKRSSKEKVIWIYAGPVIAMMANKKAVWNLSEVRHPCKPMRINRNGGKIEHSISTNFVAKPFPASSCPVDKNALIKPKNIFYRWRANRFYFHFEASIFQRASAAFRACSDVLAFAFPVPALPPLRPRATACLFFTSPTTSPLTMLPSFGSLIIFIRKQFTATACACQH